AIFTFAGLPIEGTAERRSEVGRWLRGTYRWSVHLSAQQARDKESLITNFFGSQPNARAARQQDVVGIVFLERRRSARTLSVRGRGHQHSEESLYIPFLSDQFGSQPIKQFRVRGKIPLGPKVFARANNARPKDLFPKTVRDNARR